MWCFKLGINVEKILETNVIIVTLYVVIDCNQLAYFLQLIDYNVYIKSVLHE